MFRLPAYRRLHFVIEIQFVGVEPPQGRVRIAGPASDEGEVVVFAGWTGLIQAIVQLVSPESSLTSTGRLSGELGARRHLELPEDVPQVGSNGSLRDEEALTDLTVREPLAHQPDDPLF